MYHITDHIWQGGYPMSDEFDHLWSLGIRWLFNLDLPYYEWRELEARGFHVVSLCLKDMGKDRPDRWWHALDLLAKAECLGEGSYVHCNAGISRSPTLVWLHLVLGGMDASAARQVIVTANPHACPADPAIMDDRMVAAIRILKLTA